MKKFALLPAVALLLLASCSDDDPVRPVPNDPVISVPAVADQTRADAPKQNPDYTQLPQLGSAYYLFTFDNGQELTVSVETQTIKEEKKMVAVVKKIGGNAPKVVIPSTLTGKTGTNNEPVEISVICLNLFEEAVDPAVKEIVLSKGVNMMKDENGAKFLAVTPSYLEVEVSKCPYVEKFGLEEGYFGAEENDDPSVTPKALGFVTKDGAIYTSDFKTLVAVPRAIDGTFTVVTGTENINARAFYLCSKIDAITFPASVQSIGKEAVMHTSDLLAINMLAPVAPKAPADAFGYFASSSVLRIPNGSLKSYTIVKPDVERPVEPIEPDMETGTDEEWEAYDIAMGEYNKALAAYEEAMSSYVDYAGYLAFKNIQEVNF